MLRGQRFDQAPVVDAGHVIGWVATTALDGVPNIKAALRPLRDSTVVSTDASIADVLERLATEGFAFTVDGSGLWGFVTPSDLDRKAARGYFYLLIADIEMALAQIARYAVPRERVVEGMRDEARGRWDEAVAANAETDPVEYLYLRELTALFLESPLAGAFDNALKATLEELCQFRNDVMHPTRSITSKRAPAMLESLARRGERVAKELADVVGSIDSANLRQSRPSQ